MFSALRKLLSWLWAIPAGIGRVLTSNRGLALAGLAICALLATRPWLRPPISRDFRPSQLPWAIDVDDSLLPQTAVQLPRLRRLDSVETTLLVVLVIGAGVVLVRPHLANVVFGLVVAVGIPAVAATLWNHPALYDFFETELRQRNRLRLVFRQHDEQMLAAVAPDRLAGLRERATRSQEQSAHSPWTRPWRFMLVGPWLVGLAAIATMIATSGSWLNRFAHVSMWIAVGAVLAGAVTWRRSLAEYHWALADSLENNNRFTEAESEMDIVRAVMPSMAITNRYWIKVGRLAYRQHETSSPYAAFFQARQWLNGRDPERARATIEPFASQANASAVERDLLAEAISDRGVDYFDRGKPSAAQLCWKESHAIAPWCSAYFVAHTAAQLAATPHQVLAIHQDAVPHIEQVGDRLVRSDFAALIGDAYFSIGDFETARDMYDRSMSIMHLPRYVNVHAQAGKLGM